MNELFANFFELWGFNMSNISDSLFEYNIYSTIGLVWFIVCVVVTLIYYKGIDHPRWSKRFHWLILNLITSFIIALFGYFFAYRTLSFEELGYRFEEYLQFTITIFLFSFLFIFLISIFAKKWSKSLSKTPF